MTQLVRIVHPWVAEEDLPADLKGKKAGLPRAAVAP